jgi:hypothetical protein
MESHSANPATSPDNPSTTTPQPKRPGQGRFSKEEADFLKTHLPAYETLCHQLREQARGPRGTKLVKGRKKDWVLAKVFPLFVRQFSSDQNGGPQLQSLEIVSYPLWYVYCCWNCSRNCCGGSRITRLFEVLAQVQQH